MNNLDNKLIDSDMKTKAILEKEIENPNIKVEVAIVLRNAIEEIENNIQYILSKNTIN